MKAREILENEIADLSNEALTTAFLSKILDSDDSFPAEDWGEGVVDYYFNPDVSMDEFPDLLKQLQDNGKIKYILIDIIDKFKTLLSEIMINKKGIDAAIQDLLNQIKEKYPNDALANKDPVYKLISHPGFRSLLANEIEKLAMKQRLLFDMDWTDTPINTPENNDSSQKVNSQSKILTELTAKKNPITTIASRVLKKGVMKLTNPQGELTGLMELFLGKGITHLNILHKNIFKMSLIECFNERDKIAQKYNLPLMSFDEWLEMYITSLETQNQHETHMYQKLAVQQFINQYRTNMVFLTPEEIKSCQVHFEDGKMVLLQEHKFPGMTADPANPSYPQLVDTTKDPQAHSSERKPGEVIFVYNVETDQFLLLRDDAGKVHHTSPFGMNEDTKIIAGTLTVENGKVTALTSNSGHYRPTLEAMQQILVYLDKKGVLKNEENELTLTRLQIHGYQHGKEVTNSEAITNFYRQSKDEVDSKQIKSSAKLATKTLAQWLRPKKVVSTSLDIEETPLVAINDAKKSRPS